MREGKGPGLFERRSVEQTRAESEASGYRRFLGLFDLTGIGIAAIIGAGIFFLLGLEARTTGPAVVISLLVAGAAAALAAFSYAEFASIMPGNGSAYSYAYAAFGRFPAFMMGWLFLNAYAIGNATVAVGWTEFLVSGFAQLGVGLPAALVAAPGDGGVVNVPAMVIVAIVTLLVMQGIRESTRVNNALVALKLAIVLFVILFGLFFVRPSNWEPFSPGGVSAVTGSTAILFFAYLGFDTVAAAGSEARDARRHLPLGILLSVGVATALYIAMAAVVTGMSTPGDLENRAPVAAAFAVAGHPWASGVVTAGALIALSTVVYAFHLALARILQAMGRDGFLPKAFGALSPKTGTPGFAAFVIGVFTALLAGFVPLDQVLDMSVIASIAIYVMVSVGILVLRRVQPQATGSFRVPSVLHVAAIVLLVAIVILGLGPFIQLVFLAWLGLGMAFFGFWVAWAQRGQERRAS